MSETMLSSDDESNEANLIRDKLNRLLEQQHSSSPNSDHCSSTSGSGDSIRSGESSDSGSSFNNEVNLDTALLVSSSDSKSLDHSNSGATYAQPPLCDNNPLFECDSTGDDGTFESSTLLYRSASSPASRHHELGGDRLNSETFSNSKVASTYKVSDALSPLSDTNFAALEKQEDCTTVRHKITSFDHSSLPSRKSVSTSNAGENQAFPRSPPCEMSNTTYGNTDVPNEASELSQNSFLPLSCPIASTHSSNTEKLPWQDPVPASTETTYSPAKISSIEKMTDGSDEMEVILREAERITDGNDSIAVHSRSSAPADIHNDSSAVSCSSFSSPMPRSSISTPSSSITYRQAVQSSFPSQVMASNLRKPSQDCHAKSSIPTTSDHGSRPLESPWKLKPSTLNSASMLDVESGQLPLGTTSMDPHKSRKIFDYAHRPLDKTQLAERPTEVEPFLYAPPTNHEIHEPMVHSFSAINRPIQHRNKIPVQNIFQGSVVQFWKSKFDTFNYLQSEIANPLAYSDDNMVVSAPTGAGKTVVFEMAMARFFSTDLVAQNHLYHGRQISKHRKIVYVSPSKALCEERYEDWGRRLSGMNLGVEVSLITGDGDPSESFRDLASSHLILTTPEKWDSLTRRWTEKFYLFATVKLFLVDEVHLIADENRGCTLESIICRMKSIQRAARNKDTTSSDVRTSSYSHTTPDAIRSCMRVVAVSATLPNIAEIATFLGANEAYVFDQTYRPVPLAVHAIGVGFVGDSSQSQYRFWSGMDREVPQIIHRFSKSRPTIVFCHTKADTEKLADLLATAHGIAVRGNSNAGVAGQTKLLKLQRVLFAGIAYHHAGLEAGDRRIVERAFSDGNIRVLCATSTLAMGVNLPAHLVVIKGTKAWRGGGNGYQDLDQATILQMIGRAGRPGFDTSGTAVIMTDNKSKGYFVNLATSGLRPAKSRLMTKLDDIINAEISQRVVESREAAFNWIKSTLLFIQLRSNPDAFNLEAGSNTSVETYFRKVCEESINRLHSIGTLLKDDKSCLLPSAASHIMSQHLVTYSAMEIIVNLPFDASQHQMLKAICNMEGLRRPVRRSEKKLLNEMHKMVKYKLEGPASKARVKESEQKAFVLLQASIGRIHINEFSLRQEMCGMVDFASRMLSATEEFSASGSQNGGVLVQSFKLRRALATSLWCGRDGILGQFKSLGTETLVGLRFNGINTFEDVVASNEHMIEKAAKRLPPFGSNLKAAVAKVVKSRLRLFCQLDSVSGSITPSHLICKVNRQPAVDSERLERHDVDTKSSASQSVLTYALIVHTDRPGGCLLFERNISAPAIFVVECPPGFSVASIHLLASMVGLDDKKELRSHDVSLEVKNLGNCKIARSATVPISGSSRIVRTKYGADLNPRFKKGLTSTDPRKQSCLGKTMKGSSPRQPVKHRIRVCSVTPSPRPCVGPSCYENRNSNTVIPCSEPYAKKVVMNSKNVSSCTSPLDPTSASVSSALLIAKNEHVSLSPTREIGEQDFMHPARLPVECPRDQNENICFPTSAQRSISPETRPYRLPGYGPTTAVGRDPHREWQQAKRTQMRSQQRVFARKKDNPFSCYQHDPNNAESHLDGLAGRNFTKQPKVSGIIPSEALRNLDEICNDALSNSKFTHDPSLQRNSRAGASKRPRGNSANDSHSVLAMKAAELNSVQYRGSRFEPMSFNSAYQDHRQQFGSQFHNQMRPSQTPFLLDQSQQGGLGVMLSNRVPACINGNAFGYHQRRPFSHNASFLDQRSTPEGTNASFWRQNGLAENLSGQVYRAGEYTGLSPGQEEKNMAFAPPIAMSASSWNAIKCIHPQDDLVGDDSKLADGKCENFDAAFF